MNLRDHDQPCDIYHQSLRSAKSGVWKCYTKDCPGGVAVTIDYEAAGDVLTSLAGPPRQDDELSLNPRLGARLVIDAALGISDG